MTENQILVKHISIIFLLKISIQVKFNVLGYGVGQMRFTVQFLNGRKWKSTSSIFIQPVMVNSYMSFENRNRKRNSYSSKKVLQFLRILPCEM